MSWVGSKDSKPFEEDEGLQSEKQRVPSDTHWATPLELIITTIDP
jgi:hypothetical protein